MSNVGTAEVSPRSRVPDAIAITLVGVFALAATLTGVRAGFSRVDVDEQVYRQTLLEMRDGKGYYEATRDALAAKEGAPPSQLRSIRPPTVFLLLRWFPVSTWRWLAGLTYLGTLFAVWRLARPLANGWLACLAVALAGVWVMSFAEFLFLHSEVWGAPLFLWGLLRCRRDDDRGSVALMVAAATMRELYALGLVCGWLVRRRRAWVMGLLVVGLLALVHASLASDVLDADGKEARFGNERRTLSFLLGLVSPGRDVLPYVIGVAGLALGLAGLARARQLDPAAALALPFVVVMLVLTVWSTRVYWSVVWAPALVAFAPVAVLGRAAPPRAGSIRPGRSDR